MDGVTMILLYFVLCGQVYARDCNPLEVSHGNNATISFPVPKMDGKTLLEINFLSYTTDQHLTNILLYKPKTDHKGNISITRQYFGRIERFENVSGNFSFLLLNVTFTDSGNYTMVEKTDLKGNACLLVSRQTFVARRWQPMKLILKTDEKNTSLIRIDNYSSKLSQTVVIYNVNNANCVYTDLSSMVKGSYQQCVLSNGEFSFCIPEIGWLHKGFYFAWDDRGRLLDSFFLDVQEINTEAHVETRSGKHLNSTIWKERSNATIQFYMPVRNKTTLLEINFCGYSSNQHFTNILVQQLKSEEKRKTSINSNYTGRIERLENNNETLSLLLINVMFNDSGNYTIVHNNGVKETTVVLVTRRTYMARNLEPTTLSFMVYVTNISIIRMYPMLISSQPLIFYNRTANSCVYNDITLTEETKIQTCLLRNGEFLLYIQRINWLHQGFYFAWDDKGRLLDSLSLNIQAHTTNAAGETPPVGRIERTWFIIAVIAVTILAACLVVFAVWKVRKITVRKNTPNNIMSGNGRSELPMYTSLSPNETTQSESAIDYNVVHVYDEV